jgi:uncharacterized Zn-binding protein involved in type VI secretion
MKKVLVTAVALLALAPAFTGSAEAKCGVRCLSQQVKKLSRSLQEAEQTIATQGKAIAQQGQTIAQQGQAITSLKSEAGDASEKVNALYGCLVEIPLTQYGEPEGPLGYLFQYENQAEELKTIPTTGLDATYAGDEVGGWALFDECNRATTVSAASAGALTDSVGLRGLLQPLAARP